MGPRAGLDRCGKYRPTGIRSPDRPARSASLYRLRYPGPRYMVRYLCVCVCVCIRKGLQLRDQTTTHWNLTDRNMIAPPHPVVAQQYSSTTSLSARFLSLKEKFGSRFIVVVIIFFIFKSCVSLKLRNLKLCVSGSVCIGVFKVFCSVRIEFYAMVIRNSRLGIRIMWGFVVCTPEQLLFQ